MKRWVGKILVVVAGLLCAVDTTATGPIFDLFGTVDGQGADPLVDPYPFSVFRGTSAGGASIKTAQIVFQSDDYRGVVTLSVKCCKDLLGGTLVPSGVSLDPVAVVRTARPSNPRYLHPIWIAGAHAPSPAPPPPFSLKPNQFMTGGHQVVSVGLKVTAGSSAQVGRYIAEVDAQKSDNTFASTFVTINVLPQLVDTVTTASCAAFVKGTSTQDVASGPVPGGPLVSTDPMSTLRGLFDSKDSMPAQTSWDIGQVLGDGSGRFGQHIQLSKWHAALPSTEAYFVFHNPTSYDKEYVLFDSATCQPFAVVLLKPGETGSALADASAVNTILFRRFNGSGWEAVSLMSEQPFWTVFGGKEVDFTWIEHQ